MKTYIALLRGINVGGHHKIKMASLKEMFVALGFSEVITYIQSGNVVFQAAIDDRLLLKEKIEQGIKETYGFDIKIAVKSHKEWQNIINNNPFLKLNSQADISKLHVTLLSSKPKKDDIEIVQATEKRANEELIFKDDYIYLHFPNGYGKSKFTNVFLERKLKVSTTTRNWKTMLRIAEISAKNEKN